MFGPWHFAHVLSELVVVPQNPAQFVPRSCSRAREPDESGAEDDRPRGLTTGVVSAQPKVLSPLDACDKLIKTYAPDHLESLVRT